MVTDGTVRSVMHSLSAGQPRGDQGAALSSLDQGPFAGHARFWCALENLAGCPEVPVRVQAAAAYRFKQWRVASDDQDLAASVRADEAELARMPEIEE
jgi:hypothetical protein